MLVAQWATSYNNLNSSQILDTASLEVRYAVEMKWGRRIIKDTISLLIGKKYAQTYNPRLKGVQIQRDSLFAQGLNAPSVKFLTFPEDTYLELSKQKLTCVYRCFAPGKPMQYTEMQPHLDWTIANSDMKILSYPCSQASTTFRGRSYKALFTLDIPQSLGPWKFGGLPGLILSVKDNMGDYKFQAISIKHCRELIHLWNWEYHKSNRSSVRRFVERMHKMPKTYMRTITGGHVIFRDGDDDNISFPYNPIELK